MESPKTADQRSAGVPTASRGKAGGTPALLSKTVILEDRLARFEINASGSIVAIRNKLTGTDVLSGIREPTGWEMITTLGGWREHPVWGSDQEGEVATDGIEASVRFRELRGAEGARLAISLELHFRIDGGELEIRARVRNSSAETVSELRLPFVSGFTRLAGGADDSLAFPIQLGKRIRDPLATLPKDWDSWYFMPPGHGYYNTGGFRGHCVPMWPGLASMPWMDFSCASEGVYFGAHEKDLRNVALLARARRKQEDFQIGFGFYPFAAPGETWDSCPCVIRPHSGDWREGARRHRCFASGRPRDLSAPRWVREAAGLRMILMKHQNGRIHSRYGDLPRLYREDRARGLDMVLLVFSWFRAGHDSGYPLCYEADPEMGGEEGLRRALAEIRAEGGRVILYTQGQLIDMAGEYWKTGPGGAVARKNREGVPYLEEWSFLGEGTVYPNKQFALGCPATAEWRERLLAQVRTVMGLGASGILFDQFGGTTAHLCFDKTHDHARPDGSFAGKVPLLQELHREAAASDPDFAIIGEHVCDAFLEQLDFTHGNSTAPEPQNPDDTADCAIFRYTFPDLRITTRDCVRLEQFDYGFVHGLIIEIPDVRNPGKWMPDAVLRHAEDLVRLRMRLRPWLIAGRYTHTDGIVAAPDAAVVARVFVSGDGASRAIALWNPSPSPQEADLRIEGGAAEFELHAPDSRNSERIASTGGALRMQLPPQAIRVAVESA